MCAYPLLETLSGRCFSYLPSECFFKRPTFPATATPRARNRFLCINQDDLSGIAARNPDQPSPRFDAVVVCREVARWITLQL